MRSRHGVKALDEIAECVSGTKYSTAHSDPAGFSASPTTVARYTSSFEGYLHSLRKACFDFTAAHGLPDIHQLDWKNDFPGVYKT